MAKNSLEAAQHGKEQLKAQYAQAPWFRGVGIAPHGAGFAIRLNVAQSSTLAPEFPAELDGVPIEIVRIEGYNARH